VLATRLMSFLARVPAFCALASLTLALPARASPVDRRAEVELGSESAIWGAPGYAFFGAGAAFAPLPGFELGAGVRLGFGGTLPRPAAAGYLRTSLAARAASYSPSVGLELELTSATDVEPGPEDPPGSMSRTVGDRNERNVARLAVIASPARWQWEHLLFGLGSLSIGTGLSSELGDRLYLGFTFLQLGYRP
jgi:hypothetical protein